MKATADVLLGVEGAGLCFICPLQGCSEELDPEATLYDLWIHCAETQHRKMLFNQGHLLCEFGCQQGFAGEAHRLHHYAQQGCINDTLPLGDCTYPGCDWVQAGKASGDRARTVLLNHYVSKHAPAAYEEDVEFKDDTCRLGFTNKTSMFFHMLGGATAIGKITRADRPSAYLLKVFGSYPGRENINCSHPFINSKHLPLRGDAQYDPLMCTSSSTTSPPHEWFPLSRYPPSPYQEQDRITWEKAICNTLAQLATLRSRVIFPGDIFTDVWFVGDADAPFSPATITHITDEEYGPYVVFEPHQCAMPGCLGFERPVTVLEFYTHMEDEPHARWLFNNSPDICSVGCEKGFINAHPLYRHYTEAHAQDAALIQSSLSHAQKLELNTSLWFIPLTYTTGFPSSELLRQLYQEGSKGTYSIFVYRDSGLKNGNPATRKTRLIRHCRHFVRCLRRSRCLRNTIAFVMIRAAVVKSELMPSFSQDVDLEMNITATGLPLSHTGSESADSDSFEVALVHPRSLQSLLGPMLYTPSRAVRRLWWCSLGSMPSRPTGQGSRCTWSLSIMPTEIS